MLPVDRRVQLAAEKILECDDLHFGESEGVLDRGADAPQVWLVDGASCNRRRLDLDRGIALPHEDTGIAVAAAGDPLHDHSLQTAL